MYIIVSVQKQLRNKLNLKYYLPLVMEKQGGVLRSHLIFDIAFPPEIHFSKWALSPKMGFYKLISV